MSFMDKAKEKAQQAAQIAMEQAEVAQAKAKEAAEKAATKIQEGGLVDKYAAKIDERTGGKYSGQIAKAATQAKSSVDKIAPAKEEAVDMEYSTEYGAERTETAAEAAEVFESQPPAAE
jgi:hypothetical protein